MPSQNDRNPLTRARGGSSLDRLCLVASAGVDTARRLHLLTSPPTRSWPAVVSSATSAPRERTPRARPCCTKARILSRSRSFSTRRRRSTNDHETTMGPALPHAVSLLARLLSGSAVEPVLRRAASRLVLCRMLRAGKHSPGRTPRSTSKSTPGRRSRRLFRRVATSWRPTARRRAATGVRRSGGWRVVRAVGSGLFGR